MQTKAGPVTAAERRQAQLIAADQNALLRVGINAATKIGARLQRAALRAYRANRDPAAVVAAELEPAPLLLGRAMLFGHLRGRWRSGLFSANGHGRKTIAARLYPDSPLDTPYDEAAKILANRLMIPLDALKALELKYVADALRVVKKASDKIERDLQAAMMRTTEAGAHVREGVKSLRQVFDANGMTPQNSFTLEAIFRTQTTMAYGAGRWNADQDPAIQEILWGYKYVTVGDDRVRPNHAALDGTRLPKDDPRWSEIWPPNLPPSWRSTGRTSCPARTRGGATTRGLSIPT